MSKHKGPASPAEHMKWHEYHRSLFEQVMRTVEAHGAWTVAGDASQDYARWCLADELWGWMRANLGAPQQCGGDEVCEVAQVAWAA